MAEPFLGQIMTTGFAFAPKGYALCNGQLLPIAQNQALFSLLGVTYGGDGIRTFALPDLRSRAPFGAGSSVDPSWSPAASPIGLPQGVETVTLGLQEMPAHTHPVQGSSLPAPDGSPSGSETFGKSAPAVYGAAASLVPLTRGPTTPTGGNQPHDNMQPSLTVSLCIALSGIFPSRN